MITLRRKTHKEQVVELLVRIANLQGEILKLKGENAELSRENRLLGERCNQLLKDKGELTDQIADIKANCDLAIEGRDIKIKELELELTVEKDQHQEEIELHLHAEDYIKSLEKENAGLKERLELLNLNANIAVRDLNDLLTKAKEIIRTFLNLPMPNNEEVFADVGMFLTKAEQFLKEIEK